MDSSIFSSTVKKKINFNEKCSKMTPQSSITMDYAAILQNLSNESLLKKMSNYKGNLYTHEFHGIPLTNPLQNLGNLSEFIKSQTVYPQNLSSVQSVLELSGDSNEDVEIFHSPVHSFKTRRRGSFSSASVEELCDQEEDILEIFPSPSQFYKEVYIEGTRLNKHTPKGLKLSNKNKKDEILVYLSDEQNISDDELELSNCIVNMSVSENIEGSIDYDDIKELPVPGSNKKGELSDSEHKRDGMSSHIREISISESKEILADSKQMVDINNSNAKYSPDIINYDEYCIVKKKPIASEEKLVEDIERIETQKVDEENKSYRNKSTEICEVVQQIDNENQTELNINEQAINNFGSSNIRKTFHNLNTDTTECLHSVEGQLSYASDTENTRSESCNVINENEVEREIQTKPKESIFCNVEKIANKNNEKIVGEEIVAVLSDTSDSVGNEEIKSYNVPFKADNEEENQDIYDPDWEFIRNLKTDQERYKEVRKRWKNLSVPDPNKNLTYHSYRWRHRHSMQSRYKDQDEKFNGSTKRPRENDDDDKLLPPSKRTRAFDDLSFNRRAIQRTISTLNFDYQTIKKSKTSMNRNKANKLEHRYFEYKRQLENARVEAEMVHKFYSGLPNQSLITQREIEKEQWDIEQVYNMFKRFYKWPGTVFNVID